MPHYTHPMRRGTAPHRVKATRFVANGSLHQNSSSPSRKWLSLSDSEVASSYHWSKCDIESEDSEIPSNKAMDIRKTDIFGNKI